MDSPFGLSAWLFPPTALGFQDGTCLNNLVFLVTNIWGFISQLVLMYFALHKTHFAPVSKLPGPTYTRFTDWWLMAKEFASQRRDYIHQLHQQYGPVVRLGPNEVSFTSLEALKEIYTSGGSGYDKTEFYTLFKQFNTRYQPTLARSSVCSC